MPAYSEVEKFPTTCWDCGGKLRPTRARKSRRPEAKRRIVLAGVVTAILLPVVVVGGLYLPMYIGIRPRGLFMIGYVVLLFMAGTVPGTALAAPALRKPAVLRIVCPACKSQKDFSLFA